MIYIHVEKNSFRNQNTFSFGLCLFLFLFPFEFSEFLAAEKCSAFGNEQRAASEVIIHYIFFFSFCLHFVFSYNWDSGLIIIKLPLLEFIDRSLHKIIETKDEEEEEKKKDSEWVSESITRSRWIIKMGLGIFRLFVCNILRMITIAATSCQ